MLARLFEPYGGKSCEIKVERPRNSMIFNAATLLFGLALLGFLIVLSWTDIKQYRLPDKFTFPLIALGLVEGYMWGDLRARLMGMALGYLAFISIEYGFKILRGKDGLGRGDAKLLAAGLGVRTPWGICRIHKSAGWKTKHLVEEDGSFGCEKIS